MEKYILGYLICFLSAFALSFLISPLILRELKKLKAGQTILHYVDNHAGKQGTPTMGGIIFILSASIISLIYIWDIKSIGSIAVFVALSYGLLGFLDDFIKVKHKQNEGLKAYQKIIGQAGIAIIVTIFCYNNQFIGSKILIPFYKGEIDIKWWVCPLCMFMFIGVTNAVNLTDGLDGLVSKTGSVNFFVFLVAGLLLLWQSVEDGNTLLTKSLDSMNFFISAYLGALLCFVWHNSNPAKVFMGDTGSLALGGALCCCAVFLRNPILLAIVGIMYVVTCISVIIQVVYYKITKKRVFLMAPLHHHLEKKGIHESKIVTYYTLITIFMGVIAVIGCL